MGMCVHSDWMARAGRLKCVLCSDCALSPVGCAMPMRAVDQKKGASCVKVDG